MAVPQSPRFLQFNFLVDLGNSDVEGPSAGFQECSNIGAGAPLADYRAADDEQNSGRKLPAVNKASQVTLERGLISALDFHRLDRVQVADRARTVTVQLQDEARTRVVKTWRLLGARIIGHVIGPLGAGGSDVPIEQLTLTHEGLEID